MKHTEIRQFSTTEIELRAGDGESPKIKGYAAVFDTPTDLGWFSEEVKRGAFSNSLKEAPDVRALVNHEPSQILGRFRAKAGDTLTLKEDEKGLYIELDPPDTQIGRDIVTSLKRGDLSQMSFAFRTVSDAWRTMNGKQHRELLEVKLFDVSIVTYPAYTTTEVGARDHNLEAIAKEGAELLAKQAGASAERERELDLLTATL